MAQPLIITPLPYKPDSTHWLAIIRSLPQAVWLDSGQPGSQYGRFDILSAAPQWLLQTQGAITSIETHQGPSLTSTEDPFTLLAHYLPQETTAHSHLPFVGGALGYFGYDLGRRLENLPQLATADIGLPDMQVGIYPWAIVQDHQQQQAWLVQNPALAPAYNFSQIEQLCTTAAEKPLFHDLMSLIKESSFSFKIKEFKAKVNAEKYANAVTAIQAYIAAGDCYQVNYAQHFSAHYQGDPLAAYLTLRQVLPSPFSGFMQLRQGAILSLSPERFIQVRNQQVEAKPIKGTIKRGTTAAEDTANAQWLASSEKNRAENVMIVDLLRNDLSKHCSEVAVPGLCELQSFANVHHLVSRVTGKLRATATALGLLRDSFPGGSITGAPKIRAMEIIEELELTRRSVYCGSLGYISADGQMDTSIAIRTLVCDGEQIHCWGGGGIVADSDTEQEYQESITKVKLLMDTLTQQFSSDQ